MEGSGTISSKGCLIRFANYRDAVDIQDTLWQCQLETDTPYPDPDQPYATQKLMQQAHEGMIAVAVSDDGLGRIVGAVVLGIAVWPWKHPDSANATYLINEHLYVKKRYRASGTAKKLIDWAKSRADELGLMLMLDFSTLDADVAIKDRFARINGFRYTGGKFMRLPSPSSDQKE